MFAKLAVRNVRRSVRDYSIYFLTLLFGVCVFYVFNSLQGQPVIQILRLSQGAIVEGILIYMGLFSVFVAVVLAGLILYANHFMLRRRKQELATYLLLGLPQSRLSLLLFLETLAVGLLALCAGIVLGVLAAKGLSLLTIVLFALPFADLSFLFQWDAVMRTVACFGVVFLLVMVFDLISVSRQTLSRLLTAGRRNEAVRTRPLWVSVITFLVGVACIAAAYFLLLSRGFLVIDPLWLGMLALGSVGTILFFKGFSGFVLRLCQANEKLYFKGLNLFVLRQWSGKLHSTYLSMTVVCLLLLLAIGATACTLGMNAAIQQVTSRSAPYDLTIQNYTWSEDGLLPQDMEHILAEAGLDMAALDGIRTYTLYTDENGSAVLSLPDYNALMALQGKSVLTLDDLPQIRSELIFTTYGSLGWRVVDEDGVEREGYWVLPAEQAEQLQPAAQYFVADYPAGADPLVWKQAVEDALDQAMSQNDDLQLYATQQHDIYLDQLGTKVLVLFMGMYLGITFLITAAAVLALQQLSQSADNVTQYGLLRRLGSEQRMRDKAVFFQVFLAFFLPLALAVVHAVVGMTAANAVIFQVSQGNLDATVSSFVTAGLILLVYGAYFLLTFFSSRRIVRERT